MARPLKKRTFFAASLSYICFIRRFLGRERLGEGGQDHQAPYHKSPGLFIMIISKHFRAYGFEKLV